MWGGCGNMWSIEYRMLNVEYWVYKLTCDRPVYSVITHLWIWVCILDCSPHIWNWPALMFSNFQIWFSYIPLLACPLHTPLNQCGKTWRLHSVSWSHQANGVSRLDLDTHSSTPYPSQAAWTCCLVVLVGVFVAPPFWLGGHHPHKVFLWRLVELSPLPPLLSLGHPSRTMRTPPPIITTELPWGELHWKSFGTHTRMLGHIRITVGQSCCPMWATVNTHHL